MNEKPITNVFVAPSKTKNPFLSVFEIVFPIIAACPLPKPGRKLQRGEAIIAPTKGLKSFDFVFVIFCRGMRVLFFILINKVELPNKPVSKGNKNLSEFSVIFKTLQPRRPASKKTSNAENFFFSEKIKTAEIAISRYGIKNSVKL